MAKMTAENKRLLAEIKELKALLSEFGATLVGMDPGVSANINQVPAGVRGQGCWGEQMSFRHLEWQWLKPLLEELRELRRLKKEAGGK